FIGDLTNMDYYFAKAFDYQGGGYGNAILSRFPIVKSSTIMIPTSGETKNMALITVQISGKYESKLVVGGNELVASKLSSELSTIFPVLNSISHPMLLSFDFNVFDPIDALFQQVEDQYYKLAVPGN